MDLALKPTDVAVILSVKVRYVYVLIKQKRLKAFAVGRRLRILPGDLQAYIAEQRAKGTR